MTPQTPWILAYRSSYFGLCEYAAPGPAVFGARDTLPLEKFQEFKELFDEVVSYGPPVLLDEMPWLAFPGG